MRLAIMQPYLFPYIGYFQLLKSADKFVILDDVQWIKGGWINRNRILLKDKDIMVTLSVKKRSTYDKIFQFEISEKNNNRETFLNKIKAAYDKSPYFSNAFSLISKIILNDEINFTKYIKYSLEQISAYLGIETKILVSSQLEKNNKLTGQERILEICRIMDAKICINPIGGIKLYDKNDFAANGIKLNFLKVKEIKYKQFDDNFIPNLSIIDVMMFNPPEEINKMLNNYEFK